MSMAPALHRQVVYSVEAGTAEEAARLCKEVDLMDLTAIDGAVSEGAEVRVVRNSAGLGFTAELHVGGYTFVTKTAPMPALALEALERQLGAIAVKGIKSAQADPVNAR